MRRSVTRKLAALAGIGAVVAVIAVVMIQRLGTALEPMAPVEVSEQAGPEFRNEFPKIYHPILELPGYTADRLHLQRGLGGRWGKLTLRRDPELPATRSDVLDAVAVALGAEGWKPSTLTPMDRATSVFDADPTKLTERDAQFTHVRLPNEREAVSYSCRIWISDDASEVVAYCEMGW
jgi:hypothetical protein